MTLAITLARLSRRICLVPRLHRLGYITEMHWPRRSGKTPYRDSRQAPGQSFKQNSDRFLAKNLSKKHAFSQNDKSGWPVLTLAGAAITFNFCGIPGRKDSPLPVDRLSRSTGKKECLTCGKSRAF